MEGTAISLVSFPQVLMEPELAIVVIETGKVQKEIQKSTMARTQQLAAKKKKAAKKKSAKKKPAKKKKAAKKPKKKKKKAKKKKAKKKRKKAKKKKVRFPGGKRRKGQHKSKAASAAGKKRAAAMKAKGQGLFAKKKFSPALGAIVGKPGGSLIDAVKGVWAYIKKNKLNKGRNISADAKLKGVFGGGSMFKLARSPDVGVGRARSCTVTLPDLLGCSDSPIMSATRHLRRKSGISHVF